MEKKLIALLVLCIVITTTMKLLVDAYQGTFDCPCFNQCIENCARKKQTKIYVIIAVITGVNRPISYKFIVT